MGFMHTGNACFIQCHPIFCVMSSPPTGLNALFVVVWTGLPFFCGCVDELVHSVLQDGEVGC